MSLRRHRKVRAREYLVVGAPEYSDGGGVHIYDVTSYRDWLVFEAWFDLDAVSALEQPPLLEIDMPSTVTCSTSVDLEANRADPDGDESAPRWEVDGVLLESTVSAITVNQTHQIRAIVRDDRGATTTDTHTILCSP